MKNRLGSFLFLLASISFAGKNAKADPLLRTFTIVHNSLPADAKDYVTKHLTSRSAYLQKNFPYLDAPENLTLVISNHVNLMVYRNGQMVVPFWLDKDPKEIPEHKQIAIASVLQDFVLGLAYYDRNMRFQKGMSPAWDTYTRSKFLAKQVYLLNSHLDEDHFLQQGTSADTINSIYSEDFKAKNATTQKQLESVEAKIAERNKQVSVRLTNSYLFELNSSLSYLFSDLLVSILHDSPNIMSEYSAKYGLSSRSVIDAPYRAFAPPDTFKSSPDPSAYYFTHFYTSLRPEIWQMMQELPTKEDRLELLDSFFLRMRITLKETVKKYDQLVKSTGRYDHGEYLETFLKALHLTREELNNRIRFRSCEKILQEL